MVRDVFNTLIILGAVQGIITCILLFTFRSGKQANSILAWLILLISLACLNIYFLETIQNFSPFWKVIAAVTPLIVFMPLGPLTYFYVKALLFPEFKLSSKNRPHFYSTIIDLVPYLTALLLLIGSNLGLLQQENQLRWERFIDNYYMYSDIPRWISLSIYLWFTHKMINTYRATKKQNPLISWTRRFTLGFSIFAFIWLLHLIPYLIPALSNPLLAFVGWYPVFMPLIILIYWIGINGFIISVRTYRITSKQSQLPGSTINETIAALQKAMEVERLFLNPALKLDDLVKHTGIPQKTISAVLNGYINKSFNEFINSYRIEECKLRLLKETSDKLTITGMAFECGFNSQATFQRAFKSITGLSPKEFLQKHA